MMLSLINRENTCCFSGYRPEKLAWGNDEEHPGCAALKDKIICSSERIYLSGIRHFICGMARGSDTYFCEAILALRSKYPDISIEAAVPYEAQAENWPENDRKRYYELIKRCDNITYVSKHYTKSCLLRRNRYMVSNSSVILAVYDGKSGGTAYTIKYAARKGLEIIVIEP